MIQTLIGLLAGTAVSLGSMNAGALINNLNETQKNELIQAKITAAATLSDEEKDYVESLEGISMQDLTIEEKQKLREINKKVNETALTLITDADLKAKLEDMHDKMQDIKNKRGHGKRYARV